MFADVNAYAEPKDATMHQGSVGLDTQASGSQATSLLNVSVHRVPLVSPSVWSWMQLEVSWKELSA